MLLRKGNDRKVRPVIIQDAMKIFNLPGVFAPHYLNNLLLITTHVKKCESKKKNKPEKRGSCTLKAGCRRTNLRLREAGCFVRRQEETFTS